MNRAVSSTNVVLNLAVSPSLWLIQSNIIILKNPIEGYNNRLKIASTTMHFDINITLNYEKPKEQPKKVYQHLETLAKDPTKPTPVNPNVNSKVNAKANKVTEKQRKRITCGLI